MQLGEDPAAWKSYRVTEVERIWLNPKWTDQKVGQYYCTNFTQNLWKHIFYTVCCLFLFTKWWRSFQTWPKLISVKKKIVNGIFSRKMKIVWSLLSTLSFPEVWKSVGAEIFRKFWKLFCITGVIPRSEPGPDGQVGRWRPRGHHTRLDKGQVQLWLNRHIEKDYRPALYKVAGLSDNIGAVLDPI